jgi:hypothetical protein
VQSAITAVVLSNTTMYTVLFLVAYCSANTQLLAKRTVAAVVAAVVLATGTAYSVYVYYKQCITAASIPLVMLSPTCVQTLYTRQWVLDSVYYIKLCIATRTWWQVCMNTLCTASTELSMLSRAYVPFNTSFTQCTSLR